MKLTTEQMQLRNKFNLAYKLFYAELVRVFGKYTQDVLRMINRILSKPSKTSEVIRRKNAAYRAWKETEPIEEHPRRR